MIILMIKTDNACKILKCTMIIVNTLVNTSFVPGTMPFPFIVLKPFPKHSKRFNLTNSQIGNQIQRKSK